MQLVNLRNYQENPVQTSIREGFGKAMVEIGHQNDKIIALSANLIESVRLHYFRKTFPSRCLDVGVAEQNMVGIAAGMALAGKIPVAASYASFSPARSWDQIRLSICYSNLNVKLIGGHGGITVGADGTTQQGTEDIALVRVLPNMTVLVPCDEDQARLATHAMIRHPGPVYLRLTRNTSLALTTPLTPFVIGQAQVFHQGTDLTIIACGIMVAASLHAAHILEKRHHRSVRVLNLHTIKPLDEASIIQAAKETGAIITVEDHQQIGGMGSAVAEVIVKKQPVPMEMVGLQDTFGESGQPSELLEKYHLSIDDIVIAAERAFSRKGKS